MSGRERRGADASRGGGGWRATVESFGGFATIGAIGGVLAVVVLLVVLNRPGGGDGDSASPGAAYVPVAHDRAIGRTEGDPNAPIKIVEFSDFQCPFCERHTRETAPDLRAKFIDTGIVSLEYRHLVVIGPESAAAAEGSECALEQGFFWEYHDILFQEQGAENAGVYSAKNLKAYAREMAAAWATLAPGRAFDASAFDDCLDSGRTRALVAQQTAEAGAFLEAAGGRISTPSFVINNRIVQGAQPLEVFEQVIEAIQAAGR